MEQYRVTNVMLFAMTAYLFTLLGIVMTGYSKRLEKNKKWIEQQLFNWM